ncbi:NADH-ubiquinone oxidoreductase-F iron-sulfur binding region domain-containing protein [Natrialbaceae archaeon A-gly3]
MASSGLEDASGVVRVSTRWTEAERIRRIRKAVAEVGSDVRLLEVGSTGVGGLEPLLTATVDGRTLLFSQCDLEETLSVVESLAEGEFSSVDADAVIEHDPKTTTFPTPETGPLAVGRRRVLGACGWVDPTDIDAYVDDRTVLVRDHPADGVIDRVDEYGLCGRGRGDGARDEPVADHWRTARETDGDPAIVVHGNEADPRSTADSLLLSSDPFAVLDAAVTVATLIGAPEVVVYLNEADERATQVVPTAAEAFERLEGHDVTITVAEGPDTYAAGEPTMALESLEGNDRLEARRRPPDPSAYGLYGRPTVIHTPRTLAQLRWLVAEGWPAVGVDADPGTRLVEVRGAVTDPAVVELPTDTDLSRALEAVDVDGTFTAACVGGVFGGFTRTLDVPANRNGLAAGGLGTNGPIELLTEDRCPVAIADDRAVFAREENCGRCVPCREGSKQLTELLRQTADDAGAIDGARELARVMETSSLCAFGKDAARPIATALDVFEPEFLAHVDGRCPAGECDGGNR